MSYTRTVILMNYDYKIMREQNGNYPNVFSFKHFTILIDRVRSRVSSLIFLVEPDCFRNYIVNLL